MVQCSERGVWGSAPPTLFISDDDLGEVAPLSPSASQLDLLITLLTLLETKYEEKFVVKASQTDRKATHELLNQATSAEKRVEQAKAELEVLHAEIEAKKVALATEKT